MAFSFGSKLGKNKESRLKQPTPAPKVSFKDKGSVKHENAKQAFVNKIKNFGSSTAKYTIIIGDEGAIIIYMVGKKVMSRNFIAHASADNIKEFETILAKDKKAPLYLVVDSMDQSFLQQSLPPISSLGVRKLIMRRLDRDLGADVIKGYVLLERDSTGRRDWNFLMVSLENSPHMNLWFDFVERIDNRLKGIYLLSVETENIVKSLDRAMNGGKKIAKSAVVSRWKFFVTHNKVGGFRQVILRDGRIIFTRLTQPVGEATTEVIAGNIEQEISSTIEYMKRLSFNPQQGLDLYIIASADINASLDISRLTSNKIYKFTPHEVSEYLGIEGAAQITDQFGDVILASFISSMHSHRLTLVLPKAKRVNQIYSIIQYQRATAGIALLGMIGYAGVLGLGIMQKYSELEELTQKKIFQQRKLENLNAEIERSEIDIKLIDDTVTLYHKIGNEAQSPITLFSRLRPAVIDSVLIREVLWERTPATASGAASTGGSNENIDSLTVVLHFPEISDTEEAFNAVAKKVLTDVRAVFPEYKVIYSKLPDVFAKKNEGGELSFDEQKKEVKIEKINLEATLSFTKTAHDNPALGADSANILLDLKPGMNPEQIRMLRKMP